MSRSLSQFVLLVVAFNLFMAGSAVAERQAGTVTLTPMLGYHMIDGGMEIDDAAAFGLGIGYNITQRWAIEADLRYTPTETDTDNSTDLDVWTASLGGLYHFGENDGFAPYLSLGAGVLSYDFDKGSNDEDYFGYYGGGVKYSLGKSLDLRLDARHLLDYRSDNNFSNQDNEPDWRHHLQTMVGVTYQFGAPASAVQHQVSTPLPKQETETPSDVDKDGVMTPLDRCPDTAPGVRVDSQGCPADTDADGVEDYKDACVDTPRGSKVDSRGCPEASAETLFLTRDITYGFDKDKVTPFHYKELSRVSELIKDHPKYKVFVEGHADDRGTPEYNQSLSERRAEGVRQALIEKYGLDATRIETVGFGLTRPISGNETAEERMKNRRVEIILHP